MKSMYYFVRTYWSDFVASLLAIILAWVTFSYTDNLRISFIISTFIILTFLFIILYLRSRGKDFYFIPLKNRKDKDDWIGKGHFEYSRVNKCFEITQAGHGYIYSKCLNWSDYKLEFEFKIRKDCVGAILRAVNLSNCVMMQINQEGIRPHISINGSWVVWEPKDTGLSFSDRLSTANWYKCQLICDKESINIIILLKKKIVLEGEWRLPQGNIEFPFKKDDADRNPIKIPFPINLEYGSAGFRNSHTEKALVKNVLIEKI